MDDKLIYKTASDTHTAVAAVQEQLEKVSIWSKISLSISKEFKNKNLTV